jgi:hypothetical protein
MVRFQPAAESGVQRQLIAQKFLVLVAAEEAEVAVEEAEVAVAIRVLVPALTGMVLLTMAAQPVMISKNVRLPSPAMVVI